MTYHVDKIPGLSSSLKTLDGLLTLNGLEQVIIDFLDLIAKAILRRYTFLLNEDLIQNRYLLQLCMMMFFSDEHIRQKLVAECQLQMQTTNKHKMMER